MQLSLQLQYVGQGEQVVLWLSDGSDGDYKIGQDTIKAFLSATAD